MSRCFAKVLTYPVRPRYPIDPTLANPQPAMAYTRCYALVVF